MEGDSCEGIGFLLHGQIRVYKTGASGREITLYEIFPGETCILNASCILSNRDYPATAIATEESVFHYINRSVFQKLVARYEPMRAFIFSLFSRRLGEIIELVEAVTFGKLNTRLEDYLIEKSENGEVHTTHQMIANELGTSREVITRLLKDFERQGKVLVERNRVRLLDL